MIKGLLFDLDGLLNDSEIVSWKIYQDLLQPYEKTLSLEDYTARYAGKTEKGNIEQLVAQFSLPFSTEEGMKKEKEREALYIRQGIPLKKGAREILLWAKENGIRTAMASSSTCKRAWALCEPWNIWDLFDVFVFCEDIDSPKPDPEVFDTARKRLQLKREECVVLEDSRNGILAAVRAGIPVIHIPDLIQPDQAFLEKCLAVLPDLLAARDFLQDENDRNGPHGQ